MLSTASHRVNGGPSVSAIWVTPSQPVNTQSPAIPQKKHSVAQEERLWTRALSWNLPQTMTPRTTPSKTPKLLWSADLVLVWGSVSGRKWNQGHVSPRLDPKHQGMSSDSLERHCILFFSYKIAATLAPYNNQYQGFFFCFFFALWSISMNSTEWSGNT